MIHLLFLLGGFDFRSGGGASGLLYQLAPLRDTIRILLERRGRIEQKDSPYVPAAVVTHV